MIFQLKQRSIKVSSIKKLLNIFAALDAEYILKNINQFIIIKEHNQTNIKLSGIVQFEELISESLIENKTVEEMNNSVSKTELFFLIHFKKLDAYIFCQNSCCLCTILKNQTNLENMTITSDQDNKLKLCSIDESMNPILSQIKSIKLKKMRNPKMKSIYKR